MATTIVPDTNVLISATFWTGDSFSVLRLADEGKIRCVLCPKILEEYERILRSQEIIDKMFKHDLLIGRIIARIKEKSDLATLRRAARIVRDADDDHVLACAITAEADYLVTQDEDLLVLGMYECVKITTPKQFLKEHG